MSDCLPAAQVPDEPIDPPALRYPGSICTPIHVPTYRGASEACYNRGNRFRDCSRKGTFTMAKKPANHGEPWSQAHFQRMRTLAKGNTPTGLIAHELGRTEPAVYSKASEMGISLGPTNKSPYNRRKQT